MIRRNAAGFERHLIEGRLHFRCGSFARATRELALARSRDPTRPEVHRLLGLCYARQGRMEQASEALRQALCLDPQDFVARGALAILLSQNRDPAPAIEELEGGMTLLRERAAATSQEAKAAVECGRLPEALAMLRRAAWLRLGSSVLQYYLDGILCDHCLLELVFQDREVERPMAAAHPPEGEPVFRGQAAPELESESGNRKRSGDMRRIQRVSGALMIGVLGMAGLAGCESQEQRQQIEALTKQVAQLQQENSGLKQRAESLSRENEDLKAQLEAGTRKTAPPNK